MKIYNTMSHQKEVFEPLEPGKVKIYACGPTVYNYFHLGNARPFITFDTLRRFFEYIGYDVTFVQNFTDIDDKMIRKANEEGISVRQLADRYIEAYFEDAKALNIKKATYQPKATETMDDILAMIQTLVDKDFAYVSEDGVYFEPAKFDQYGALSGHHLEDLLAGASNRLGDTDHKRHPMDFALWKFKKEGEPFWESPWGDGRPGWHIECSAMIRKYLGETIDIHGGGQDLVFPHHENEIAQSECASGHPFVRYWMHNGFVNIDNEKMSKSAGNFFTVRDILQTYDPMVLRFFILSGHYRSPLNFSYELLDMAQASLQRILTCLNNLTFLISSKSGIASTELLEQAKQRVQQAREEFIEVMSDDLNTSDAVRVIFDLVRDANTLAAQTDVTPDLLVVYREMIVSLGDVLGLVFESNTSIPQEVLDLVARRTKAKQARDFQVADQIRDQVLAMGYKIEDTPEGPHVVRA